MFVKSPTIIKTKRYDNLDAIDPIFNGLVERHCNQQLVFENGIHFRAFLQEKKAFSFLQEILEANLRKALQWSLQALFSWMWNFAARKFALDVMMHFL